jgi:GntR family transcriptional regulator, transcriptional repressor for pyruvate dehydrogenase complex
MPPSSTRHTKAAPAKRATPRKSPAESSDAAPRRTAWLELDRTEKVPEMLARRILRDIVRRQLQPGDMLPAEAVMLQQFGVGRASLREALRILEIHGVIRIKPGPRGGPMVAPVEAADYARSMTVFLFRSGATYRDLCEARLIMEPVMAAQTAERATPAERQALVDSARHTHDLMDASPDEWSESSERFHFLLAAASGNRVLNLFSGALMEIHAHRLERAIPGEQRKLTCRAHDQIADAIMKGNAKRAEDLARKHVGEFVDTIKKRMPTQLDEVIDWL